MADPQKTPHRKEKKRKEKIVTTTVDQTTYDEAKKLGVKFNHLIRLGLKAYQNNPQLIARLTHMEIIASKHNDQIQRLYSRVGELEEKTHSV